MKFPIGFGTLKTETVSGESKKVYSSSKLTRVLGLEIRTSA